MFSGFSIYDTAQFIRPPVFTVIAGLAASMGSVISLTAQKERRFALPNSKLLIHQPLIAGVMRGSASELEIHAADIIATKKRLHQLYAERTGTPIEVYQELMERDHWIEPKRAVELGMVSKIIHNREELEAELKKIKS
jgi:ATP-dependent Clp protease protease subunit